MRTRDRNIEESTRKWRERKIGRRKKQAKGRKRQSDYARK